MIKIINTKHLEDDQQILPYDLGRGHSTYDKKIMGLVSSSSMAKSSCERLSFRSLSKENDVWISEDSSLSLKSKHLLSSKESSPQNKGKPDLQHVALAFNAKKIRKQDPFRLKKIVEQQKTKLMVRNFVNKIGRNNTNSQPVQYYPFETDQQLRLYHMQGFQLDQNINNVMAILSVIQIISLTIIYTLQIVFEQVDKFKIVSYIQTFSLVFYLFQIVINFMTIKQQQGKRLMKLSEIWHFYLKTNFPIDSISLIILIIDLSTNLLITKYLRLFIITKLSQVIAKIQRLQVSLVSNFYKQQYWSLAKVFLFNICFAHVLAISLVAMSDLSQSQNWMIKKGIDDALWFQKYVWSYYWGTTIMFTVGFGDLCATTYQEAMVLTLIQMISCMALAYNINCVGTLISNIRSQDLQKSKNFKVFKKLAQKNNVTDDLQWRINNYIQESSNIKKKFNYEQENQFVLKLPKGLKTQFLKESNKKIFQNLPFFKNLMEKTLFNFAERIQMRVCHPEQLVQHIDDNLSLQILKGGMIGYSVKKSGCDFNTKVIEQIQIKDMDEPYLLDLNFIRKNRKTFQIKSLEYSILYCLDYESIVNILKGSEMDYQLYCLLRDKSSHIPDQFQLFKCQICKKDKNNQKNHTKFTCPKLHYIPFSQHIINKFLHKCKKGGCRRQNQIGRIQNYKIQTLKYFITFDSVAAGKGSLKNLTKTKKKTVDVFNTKGKKFQQIEQGSNTIGKQFQQIKNFFSQNTAELIKNQVGKALKFQELGDEVWNIQSDKMKNYKSYFQSDNSCNLSQKFSVLKRRNDNSSFNQETQEYFGISKKNVTSKSIREFLH